MAWRTQLSQSSLLTNILGLTTFETPPLYLTFILWPLLSLSRVIFSPLRVATLFLPSFTSPAGNLPTITCLRMRLGDDILAHVGLPRRSAQQACGLVSVCRNDTAHSYLYWGVSPVSSSYATTQLLCCTGIWLLLESRRCDFCSSKHYWQAL